MKCDADLNCSIHSGVGQAAYKHAGLQGEGRSQSQSSQILTLLGLFGISCERRNCEVGFCHCPHLFVNKVIGNTAVVLQFPPQLSGLPSSSPFRFFVAFLPLLPQASHPPASSTSAL